ncbi:MAG TPA: hypothetical protein VHB70_16785 [Parafilimonas sp.]|nr:hypothetical protein [Parafilimonas sp.]
MSVAITKRGFLISLMLFAFFYSKEQKTEAPVYKSTNSEGIERKIFDTISKLPEYKARALYIEKKTSGKRHLAIVIYKRPSNKIRYYWIKAVEDNGTSFYTHFNFYIYTDPFSIKYYDVINDVAITLEEWRLQTKAQSAKVQ